MTDAAKLERLLAQVEGKLNRERMRFFQPWSVQRDFFDSGREWRFRLFMAANQVGKTTVGAFEMACHLTGEYPDWWQGIRYFRPTRWWAGSDTFDNTRDNIQQKLLGPPEDPSAWGTGMIPSRCIVDTPPSGHTEGMVDHITVRHSGGGTSLVRMKAYTQPRERWQGEVLDGVWYDEEPPLVLWTEGLTRTNTKPDGRCWITATPLKGMSDVILAFMNAEGGVSKSLELQ